MENKLNEEEKLLIKEREKILETIQFIQFLERVQFYKDEETQYLQKIVFSEITAKFIDLSAKLWDMELKIIHDFEIKENLESFELYNKYHMVLSNECYISEGTTETEILINSKKGYALSQLSWIKRHTPTISCIFLRQGLAALVKAEKPLQ
jgi:hypothetical protein